MGESTKSMAIFKFANCKRLPEGMTKVADLSDVQANSSFWHDDFGDSFWKSILECNTSIITFGMTP